MIPYNIIKNAIVTGKYEPGKRLTEEALAEELGVSRTPIREAIQQLEFDGLVTPLKKGVIVRKFNRKDIRQIYDLRALLESFAASEAAFNRTEEDLKHLKKTKTGYKDAVDRYIKSNNDDLEEIVQENQKFHDAILIASKNDYLKFHIEKVVVVPLVFRSFYWYNHKELIRSHNIHVTILNAIKNQELERAKTALREHVYQARDHVLKHTQQQKNELSKEN